VRSIGVIRKRFLADLGRAALAHAVAITLMTCARGWEAAGFRPEGVGSAIVGPNPTRNPSMVKPNYSFEKRQRELAKKRKKEEKAQRKANPAPAADEAMAPSESVSAADTAGTTEPKPA
jgi:hypothetical protein